MDAAALPKGHILGWVAPSSESQQKAKGAGAPPNKNAKKRANQRAKKEAEKSQVKDNWEDEDDAEKSGTPDEAKASEGKPTPDAAQDEAEVTDKLSKLKV